jgi:pyruvate/2-oxoglutarate/acetoin dehydrogenase E1 component
MKTSIRVLESLNVGLREAMSEDDSILILGEDIVDPYGGAFKVTKGLSTQFPGRVISTPISEAGITGVCIGLSLKGFRPVLELMFGDFLTLAVDQLLNQASKISAMCTEPISLPLVLRTPMGGRRGYGPTHSQSIEKLAFGIPGIKVLACSHLFDPGQMLKNVILKTDDPIIFVENKVLYAELVKVPSNFQLELQGDLTFPSVVLRSNQPSDVSIIAYGGMASMAIEAAMLLKKREGLVCEIVIPHLISPLDTAALLASALRTRRVVVVEEGIGMFGWGAEVTAFLSNIDLAAPVQRIGAVLSVIPAARSLEDEVLPQIEDIVDAAVRTVDVGFIG